MKTTIERTVALGAVFVVLTCSAVQSVQEAEGDILKIYLLREVVVEGEGIDLASVGIVRGAEAAVSQAKSVSLGRFALRGQRIMVDRATILSCLASAGIDSDKVAISGATKVTVRRDEETVASDMIIAAAQEYVEKHLKGSASKVIATTRLSDVVLDESTGEVEFVARPSKYSTKARPRVWVSVVQGGVEKKGFDIAFSLRYKSRRAVTTADISRGAIVGAENIRIETVETSTPEASGWSSPYGMIARRPIRKGVTVKQDMVGPAVSPVLIKRRQTVLVKVETAGLYISSFGEAMEDGKEGQFIRVKMGTTREARTIVGKVGADGSVSPKI